MNCPRIPFKEDMVFYIILYIAVVFCGVALAAVLAMVLLEEEYWNWKEREQELQEKRREDLDEAYGRPECREGMAFHWSPRDSTPADVLLCNSKAHAPYVGGPASAILRQETVHHPGYPDAGSL